MSEAGRELAARRWDKPGARKAMAEASRRRWAAMTPEERRLERRRAHAAMSPEQKERWRARLKASYARRSAEQKAAFREKMREAMRKYWEEKRK